MLSWDQDTLALPGLHQPLVAILLPNQGKELRRISDFSQTQGQMGRGPGSKGGMEGQTNSGFNNRAIPEETDEWPPPSPPPHSTPR